MFNTFLKKFIIPLVNVYVILTFTLDVDYSTCNVGAIWSQR